MTQLVDQGAADEARGSRDEHSHGRRVYWGASALLAAALLVSGCFGSNDEKRVEPRPEQSFLALDAEQQRLVADYQPVSRRLASYEVGYRDWRAGHLSNAELANRARDLRDRVARALARVRRDPATGPTAHAKTFLVAALEARRRALEALLDGRLPHYRREWDRSVVEARRGLTALQEIRDRARLIPLPEDSVS